MTSARPRDDGPEKVTNPLEDGGTYPTGVPSADGTEEYLTRSGTVTSVSGADTNHRWFRVSPSDSSAFRSALAPPFPSEGCEGIWQHGVDDERL